jgi:hypothetical protein
MKYYKVVATKNNREKLTSSWHFNYIEYKLNEWTIAPKNTRLFVFDDLDRAKAYAARLGYDCDIYECKIIGGIKGYGSMWEDEEELSYYWNIFNNALKMKKGSEYIISRLKKVIILKRVPAVLTKKVKLTNRIYV